MAGCCQIKFGEQAGDSSDTAAVYEDCGGKTAASSLETRAAYPSAFLLHVISYTKQVEN